MSMDTCKPGAPTPLGDSILCALNEVDMLAATLESQALSIVGRVSAKTPPPELRPDVPQPVDFTARALNKVESILRTLSNTQDMLSRFI